MEKIRAKHAYTGKQHVEDRIFFLEMYIMKEKVSKLTYHMFQHYLTNGSHNE